jgi:hypothetical protein
MESHVLVVILSCGEVVTPYAAKPPIALNNQPCLCVKVCIIEASRLPLRHSLNNWGCGSRSEGKVKVTQVTGFPADLP